MSTQQRPSKLYSPLLDRLLDDHPEHAQDRQSQLYQSVDQLRERVRRDLEHLFNARFRCIAPPKPYPHLEDSLLNYGLPDIATLNLGSSKAQNDFCRTIENTIKRFEPRIRAARVRPQKSADDSDPTLHFRVEATLIGLTTDERIVFDSALNPMTRDVDVAERET